MRISYIDSLIINAYVWFQPTLKYLFFSFSAYVLELDELLTVLNFAPWLSDVVIVLAPITTPSP